MAEPEFFEYVRQIAPSIKIYNKHVILPAPSVIAIEIALYCRNIVQWDETWEPEAIEAALYHELGEERFVVVKWLTERVEAAL